MEPIQFSKIDKTDFVDHETYCLATYNFDDDQDYTIVALSDGYSNFDDYQEDARTNYAIGVWFKRGFWFDDENHNATCVIPFKVAKRYLDKQEYEDEKEYALDLADPDDPDDSYHTHIHLWLGQINSHPWTFTDITEEELLEFYEYDSKMLDQGAYYNGWCDG